MPRAWRVLPVLLPIAACTTLRAPADRTDPDGWARALRAVDDHGLVDYGRVDRDALAAYVAWLAPERRFASRDDELAFWINAYNAFTIKKVVDKYPLKSIRDLSKAFGLKSIFDKEFIPLEAHHPDGKDDKLSLNDIEHEILRPRFKDARVHAAINCASKNAPRRPS